MKESLEKDRQVIDRRQFLHRCASAVAGITIVGVVAPLLQSCEPTALPTPPIDAGGSGGNGGGNNGIVAFDVSALTADGMAVATTIRGSDGLPIMVVRRGPSQYTALSMRCTHQSQQVNSAVPVGGPISCPYHGSRYNLD